MYLHSDAFSFHIHHLLIPPTLRCVDLFALTPCDLYRPTSVSLSHFRIVRLTLTMLKNILVFGFIL